MVEEVVEHCVSSRWGFTCLTPRNAPPKILDVLVAKAKADASMMARFAGRSMLGGTAGWLSYETYGSLRDMRNYPSAAFDATLPQARRTRIATAPDASSAASRAQPARSCARLSHTPHARQRSFTRRASPA